jgi:hypothetical protein
MTQEDNERYFRAMHAMQSGVAMQMNWDTIPTEPKHLRVGVNSALVDFSALMTLLINKGVISRDELDKALADMAEEEVKRYERIISERDGENGPTIKLR